MVKGAGRVGEGAGKGWEECLEEWAVWKGGVQGAGRAGEGNWKGAGRVWYSGKVGGGRLERRGIWKEYLKEAGRVAVSGKGRGRGWKGLGGLETLEERAGRVGVVWKWWGEGAWKELGRGGVVGRLN